MVLFNHVGVIKTNSPFDVKFHPKGQWIFVSDYLQPKIHIALYSAELKSPTSICRSYSLSSRTRYLAIGDDFLIVSSHDHSVRRYNFMLDPTSSSPTGEDVPIDLSPAWNSSEHFDTPNGLAIHDSNVYVCDFKHHCVKVLSLMSGKLLKTINNYFNFPYDLDVNREGNLLVCDRNNHMIKTVSSTNNNNGMIIKEFGRYGSHKGEFNFPEGISIDKSSGNIFISDCLNNRIQLFNSKGEFLALYGKGKSGSSLEHLSDPHGIDSLNDVVLIADFGNKRIQILKVIY